MRNMTRLSLLLSCVVCTVALAQPARPARPPGLAPGPGERAFAPAEPAAAPPPAGGAEKPAAPKKPTCEEVRRTARYNVYFDKVEIEKLVQTVSDATCKTFILPENVRGKISIIGPEAGKVAVSADEFYAAFLAALDANSLSLYPHGKFLKIVDKQRAKQFPIPTVLDPSEQYTTNEQMMTRMFKVKYVEIEQLRGVLQQLVTPSGDTIPFQPDTIIINDLASNMKRLERIVEQLDSKAASDEIRIIQIQYATAQEIADKVQKLFESKAQKPGQRPGGNVAAMPPPPPGGTAPGQVPAAQPGHAGESAGPATLSQLIPDERTNKLIVIASPAAYERILALIAALDIPGPTGDKINVYALENANAEDLASTLQTLAQGTANRPKAAPGQPPPPKPAGGAAAELFQGEVKISADKATNALVVIASASDYRSLVKIIEKLDVVRKQVFVEAVIMEVNLDRSREVGVNLHGGVPLRTDQGTLPLLFGTKYGTSGLPPSLSLANLASLSGFLTGLQGPTVPGLEIGGVQIPGWGIILNALQSSSDVNVLSTPHILATDNEDAEITVGQNVPFQSGFAPQALGGLGGLTSQIPGVAGAGLGAGLLGGLGSAFAPIQRQNVELKLSIKPQINESDMIRMTINEQTEEIASRDPVLGPTTAKRTAKTTIVARDQETIVIGGIMQERVIEGVKKVPILGDIPLFGNLFRQQTQQKIKTNLLLFLTPYIIRDSSDFRRIFERKMKERQQFVEQFYGAVSGYDVAIDFSRKPGPLARMTQSLNKEMQKYENGGPGQTGEKLIQPAPGPGGGKAPDVEVKEPPPGGEGATPMVAPKDAPTPQPERLEVQ